MSLLETSQQEPVKQPDHDVLIIGAGVSGIYMLHRARELGLDAKVVEAGSGVGGTWYWNRYPGARFDSESYTYGYSFDKEILQNWSWSERFAGQPETERYLNFVTDKLNLRDDMLFNNTVASAIFDESSDVWSLTLADGRTLTSRFLITAIGILSAATKPRVEGVESFEGQAYHTYYWPKEPVELSGKKVAVVGTGATGVQVIGAIADKVDSLTVFQRTPNWCAPLGNAPIDADEMTKIKARYDEIFSHVQKSPGGFEHYPDRRSYHDLSEEERLEHWERIYQLPGFPVWISNFVETLVPGEPNQRYSEFIANKIRSRVTNPEVAEKLIPKDHPFGARRVPLETNYYEAYNRDNVRLVDLNETPIERITSRGIKTSAQEHEFDIIIFATGFDAVTGSFDRINIRGTGGQKLKDKWRDGPITYLGNQVRGFPNMAIVAGPQSGTLSSNFPPGIEFAVEWTAELLEYMREHNYQRFEPDDKAESNWTQDIADSFKGTLFSQTHSWVTGYNSNVDGHEDTKRCMLYSKGAPNYRKHLRTVAANDYPGIVFS